MRAMASRLMFVIARRKKNELRVMETIASRCVAHVDIYSYFFMQIAENTAKGVSQLQRGLEGTRLWIIIEVLHLLGNMCSW